MCRVNFIFPLGFSVVLFFAVFLLTSGTVVAAPQEMKVGFVDMQKALASTKAGSKAKTAYEEEVKKAQQDIDSKKESLKKMQDQFVAQKDSLSEEARLDKKQKIEATESDLKRSYEFTEEKLRRKNNQLVGDLLKKMREVVDNLGREEGYTVILEKGAQSVLYADNSIDLTDKVVEKFNSKNN